MQQISREEAEQFMQNSEVVDSRVEQSLDEIKIRFSLSSQQSVLVVYKVIDHQEEFYLDHLLPSVAK